MSSTNTILLLGYRKAAITTAHRLGLQILLWDDKRKPTTTSQLFQQLSYPLPENPVDITDTIKNVLLTYNIRAVIALTEKTVVLASVIRNLLGLPGNSIKASQACHDKFFMKKIAVGASIPITAYTLYDGHQSPTEIVNQLGLPLVIKQRDSSGSRGIHYAHGPDDLTKNLQHNLLVEKFIQGKEYSVESFISHGKILFSNITEYYQLKFSNIIPAEPPDKLQNLIQAFNEKVLHAFQVKSGIAHVEIYATPDGLLFGELAIRPPGGYIMELLKLSYRFDPWEAVIKLALDEKIPPFPAASQYSAVQIIHPGRGIVTSIKGLDYIKQIPTIKKINLRCHIGDTLFERIGLGQDYGYIIVAAPTRDEVVNTLEEIAQTFKIQLRNLGLYS